MGFGTLFFGYFLFLNITYYSITDLIASLIIAMGLYKLSDVNTPFKNGFYSSFLLSAVGLAELVIQMIGIFNPRMDTEAIISYVSMPRHFIIAIITFFILQGIQSVADEVGLKLLAKRARNSIPVSLTVYALLVILEVPALQMIPFLSIKALIIISVLVLFAAMIIVIVNLVTIYKAYMKICMPDDVDNDVPDKPSRFGFINKHREHTAQKQREYAEYKLEKFKKKI